MLLIRKAHCLPASPRSRASRKDLSRSGFIHVQFTSTAPPTTLSLQYQEYYRRLSSFRILARIRSCGRQESSAQRSTLVKLHSRSVHVNRTSQNSTVTTPRVLSKVVKFRNFTAHSSLRKERVVRRVNLFKIPRHPPSARLSITVAPLLSTLSKQ